MSMTRREFLQVLAAAGAAGMALPGIAGAAEAGDPYDLPRFGNVSLLHLTDSHAQLLPVYYREPHLNLGVAGMRGQPPHLVGEAFLRRYGIPRGGREAYAFTYLDYVEAARRYGRVGGYAHLATLVRRLRESRPGALLLDGGDTWQGSATSLWSNAQDMVDAQLLLGVDVMTPHWEFTFGASRVMEILEQDFEDRLAFVAQNVVDNEWEEPVFEPYVIREVGGVPVAVIGQAFPYTPVANPRYLIPQWSMGIREERLQGLVEEVRGKGAQVVVLLSHNGMDVDLKLASRVRGLDAILGGHTHDAVPEPVVVANPGGRTLVTNAGSNGKFLGVLDLDVRGGRVRDFRYRLVPVFADLLPPDPAMARHIREVRAPYAERLGERLAVAGDLLYRRGNFNGTFDQLICDALMAVLDAEIAFSPGFRWGTTVLPGDPITFEDVMNQTAITYPVVTRNELTGEQIKLILEDVADNLFNKDPYYQQGGDMVRVGGLRYAIDPEAEIGHRIRGMELGGRPLDPNKTYVVASWASVAQRLEGRPVWDVVAEYLRGQETVRVGRPNVPRILGMEGNPGLGAV
ncbi:thiosulfohydrolase SoxB [Inmirania thermothiophila]|uniref:Sulfate thiol esterase SoxB n=1 Tax=Inmirania thermothiophila TaxID=1750597 RepID=A0A3N1XT19_9GAMM|nr:thiosulfohydrolase SoxB [Inmirania thermothiophila]ROR29785.1 sulfate thiol esterase SoxB [Inmirania thermothiophila]